MCNNGKFKRVRLSDLPSIEEMSKADMELCRVDAEGDGVYLGKGDSYYIDFDRCDSVLKILHWVNHLVSKTWITGRCIELFIGYTTKKIGVNIHSARC